MTDQLKALAEKYFEAYPAEQVLHFSSDGQVFLQKNHNDAKNHQRRIDEKTELTTVWRKELNAPMEIEAPQGDNEVPDETFTKEEIVEWLQAKGIEAEMKEKKEELLNKVVETLKGEEDPDDDGTGDPE